MIKSTSMISVYSGTFIFAVWYLVFSADIVFIAPQTKIITDASFPCAYHDCSCKTAEQCRTNCCCFRNSKKQAAFKPHRKHHKYNNRIVVNISYLSSVKCKGNYPDNGISNKKIDQSASLTTSSMKHPHFIDILPIFKDTMPCPIFKDPPEKIPILSIHSIS